MDNPCREDEIVGQRQFVSHGVFEEKWTVVISDVRK